MLGESDWVEDCCRPMAYEEYRSLDADFMQTEVGPVNEVTSVSVRPG